MPRPAPRVLHAALGSERHQILQAPSLALLLAAVADDQRDEARMQAESAARAAGVRSVAPLVACFLPAFILIGIVPIVASLALPLLQ